MQSRATPLATGVQPEAITVVQKAAATGKQMAAQQSASQILYSAGVLKGKHYASQYDFPGAINMGNGVVQDGNLTTSGVCPNISPSGIPIRWTNSASLTSSAGLTVNQQRFYNILCWVYGQNPDANNDLVSEDTLPQDRADQCPEELAKLDKAWNTLLAPFVKEE